MKHKQFKIITIGIAVLILVYLLVNLPFIFASIQAKSILSKMDYASVTKSEKILAGNYVRNISEIRIRKCTAGAKLILLECNMYVQEWVLGKEKSFELNQYLKNMEQKNKLLENEIKNNDIPSEEELIKFNNEFDIGG